MNLYGQSVNMKELKKVADKYNIKILEDCAQSAGANTIIKCQDHLVRFQLFLFIQLKI